MDADRCESGEKGSGTQSLAEMASSERPQDSDEVDQFRQAVPRVQPFDNETSKVEMLRVEEGRCALSQRQRRSDPPIPGAAEFKSEGLQSRAEGEGLRRDGRVR